MLAPLQAEVSAWRRDIHAHPELGFQEQRTAALVAAKREAFGFDEVRRGVGRTGVVGVLRAGSSRRCIGLRADMDALPILELDRFGRRSVHPATVNDAAEAEFAARICCERVGADRVDRQPPLLMASEDFSFMLEKVPGCHLNIGNGAGEGAREVHNPACDCNDAALPPGAAFFVRAVETRPAAG
jgi:metal-dependent amidase/aminoacylase/carboxypeptidase family protein